MLCFRKFPVEKKFMDKRGEVSRFCFEIFLSHSAEKFRRGTLLCCVSENLRWRKSLWIRGGWGEVSRFSFENFLSDGAEKFRRGTFLCCVSEKFR